MPIVNGTYVFDTMPQSKGNKLSTQVFGPDNNMGSKDWSDTTTAAYNYLLKQQENAFNVDMWNLANEYNSPKSQMLRYQEAGLNPNLIYSQQNTTSPIQAAANQAFRSQGTQARKVQNQLATIGQLESLVKSARDTYDYLSYGRETNYWNMINAQESVLGQKMENSWNDWLLHGDNMIYGDSSRLPYGPRATMYQTQQNSKDAEWRKLEFMVGSLMPSQKEANDALTRLRENQADIQDGKFGAVLDIDLGLGPKVNQWARLIIFLAMARMM